MNAVSTPHISPRIPQTDSQSAFGENDGIVVSQHVRPSLVP